MKTRTAVLLTLVALLALAPIAVPDLSAQDTDGAQENTSNDGFDWGWLGLLGLLGLMPRKPIEERVDHTNTAVRH